MEARTFERIADLPTARVLGSGTPLCAGCGGLEAVGRICDIIGERSLVVNGAGCMTLLAVYPFTPFRGSWLYTAMASAPAGAQGVRDALDILLAKGRITPEEDLTTVVLAGDGSSSGIALSAISAAIDRNLDFIHICYDNEGYGNTGQQASATTPRGARTATSRGAEGHPGRKKDLFALWAAHRPAYVATVAAAEPLDLARKVARAMEMRGPRLVIALAPCPTGWEYDPAETVKIGRLAVRSGAWPLKEYLNGEVIHTLLPRHRISLEAYLRPQGRFAHLFRPRRNRKLLEEMQRQVDHYWEQVT